MSRSSATTITNSSEHIPLPLTLTVNRTGEKREIVEFTEKKSKIKYLLSILGLIRDNDIEVNDTTTVSNKRMEVFTCIAYSSSNQTLCAGTNQGRLFTWKKITTTEMNDVNVQPNYTFEYAENAWQLHNISTVRGAVKHCAWGVCDVNKPCVMLNCISNVYILKVSDFQFYRESIVNNFKLLYLLF